jgi:hypothetical protein
MWQPERADHRAIRVVPNPVLSLRGLPADLGRPGRLNQDMRALTGRWRDRAPAAWAGALAPREREQPSPGLSAPSGPGAVAVGLLQPFSIPNLAARTTPPVTRGIRILAGRGYVVGSAERTQARGGHVRVVTTGV